LFDILWWGMGYFWLDCLTRGSRMPRRGRHFRVVTAGRVGGATGAFISCYARIAGNFDNPGRIQEETAESEGSTIKSAAMPAAVAADRGEMRVVKSQAGHILKGWPIIKSCSVESGISVVAAANYAARRSRARNGRATSGAWPARANIDASRSGANSRNHHAGAACRYRRGSVCAAMLRRGECRKGEYHHCCYRKSNFYRTFFHDPNSLTRPAVLLNPFFSLDLSVCSLSICSTIKDAACRGWVSWLE
jgi:hypothetical protein